MTPRLLRDRLRAGFAGRLLLWAASIGYSAVILARHLLYLSRLLPTKHLPVRVVCIGNITTGGTGKTTAVMLAAATLCRKGIKVAVLSRGYGRRKKSKEIQVLLDPKEITWQETGDEPWMMHQTLKKLAVPIVISSDRFAAGQTAVAYYAPDLILLDDGFQHLRLHRDFDVVLISALDPFGGDKLLPAGNLREPPAALRRADLAILTHTDQVTPAALQETRERILALNPGLRVFEAVHAPDFFLDLKTEEHRPLGHLKDKPASSFCALGDPRPFEAQLRGLGAKLAQSWRFQDHHPYTEEELRSIDNVRNGASLVTTMKDFVRFPPGWRELLTGEVLALTVKMELVKGAEEWESALTGMPAASEPSETPQ
ncbi:MAG: tetraacyldisaccharide 4'-kinase [Elusimicrobia bacterium GWA2_69_24]|nr:MAG: tetraacyldisaccharide 4'-kinase [Elusimicrobia bacterium GWA2_69_24]